MEQTPNLLLPYIMAAQAQKHLTHNEALLGLDAIIQLSVASKSLSVPPATPADGDRYIVGNTANGSWLGKENMVAAWQDGAWLFYQPVGGWLCWVVDEGRLLAFDNAVWVEIAASESALENAAKFGINTTADSINRLSVKTDAALFSYDDVTPGSGDIRAILNKLTTGNTASFLFQNTWSGRAEIGLAGDDDFHLKVSADGTSWNEAMVVDAPSGAVTFPQNAMPENLVFNLFQDGGRFSGSPEPVGVYAGAFVPPVYLSTYNGSNFSSQSKFINNNSTNGGTGSALDPVVGDLITALKTTATARRSGPEFWVMNITAGSGTAAAKTIGATTRYRVITNRGAPLWPKSTWGTNICVQSGSVSIDYSPTIFRLYVDGVEQGSDVVINPSNGWVQIVYVGVNSADSHIDYDSTIFKLRAEPGSVISTALPFLVPAQIQPKSGFPFGRIGSLEAWR